MDRRVWAWASYDWANSAFPTVVSTFVIAAYFSQGIAPDPATGQAQWGWMQTLAGIVIAFASPVLGAIADAGGMRRRMLAVATVIMAVATGLIWFATPSPSSTLWALACVGIATIAFEVGTVFYNAMLPDLAPREKLGKISGLAWGLGYAGGLCCLGVALALLVMPNPSPLGLDRGQAEHVRATAVLVAVWVAVFGWPVLVALPDRTARRPWRVAAKEGLAEIMGLVRRLPQTPVMARFLIARLFYTDGLNTLFAFGAIYAAGVFGMGFEEILMFGIALNVTAGLGAAGFGLIEDRFGSRSTVLVSLGAMIVLGVSVLLVTEKLHFWLLAMALGIFMGPSQAASRTLMAKLAPKEEVTAWFGLFALSGRVTGFIGPGALALVTALTESQRAGMGVVVVLLALGLLIMLKVREAD
ncbi:MFS transporter [Acetobacteraceae bacterium H6797]|nr:MFS transporter [Acetobacteraceae bacterium H6797]